MDSAGSFVGVSGSISTGLGSRSGSKKKARVESVYSHGASFKKVRKPVMSGTMIDSSVGLLYADSLLADGGECKASWDSEVENESNNVSKVSDLENMKNLVAKETSYINSNIFGNDDLMDDTISKKTRTRTYVLDKPLKQLSFNLENDNNSVLELPPRMFVGSNQLLLSKSHGLECRRFKPVKSFTLDVELLAVPGKSNSDKLFKIKKIFYKINGFGSASTSSKFPGVIRSTFTSESSLVKARELAICEKIIVNNNLKKVNIHLNREVIIKKIPVNFPKSAVEAVFSKFGKIASIKMQLIGLWQKALVEFELLEVANLVAVRWSVLVGKDSVCVAKAVNDKQIWVSRDQHWALLYTLPVGTTTHDLSGLVEAYDEKTCFIGRNPTSYVCDRCAVISFESEASKLAAIGSVLVFKGVSLHWANFSLACCAVCKQFGHVSDVCSMSENSGACSKWVVTFQDRVRLANVYRRKQALIAHPVSFGGKTWVQVASGTLSCVVPSSSFAIGASFGAGSALVESSPSDIFGLCNRVASLERSLELLTDQVSAIVKKLSCVEVVSLVSSSLVSHPIASASLASCVDLDITLDVLLATFLSLCPTVNDANPDFGSSSSKVLTAKVGGLESKLMALDASVGSVLARLDMLCSGLGSLALSSS
ncbi:hypothetical protein G9A89_004215 [Geosiphon pyriformis]|nr:hypothetical protein G9A89_004215 [Geosiphon pyriformis]